jgi:hypothetical protein
MDHLAPRRRRGRLPLTGGGPCFFLSAGASPGSASLAGAEPVLPGVGDVACCGRDHLWCCCSLSALAG